MIFSLLKYRINLWKTTIRANDIDLLRVWACEWNDDIVTCLGVRMVLWHCIVSWMSKRPREGFDSRKSWLHFYVNATIYDAVLLTKPLDPCWYVVHFPCSLGFFSSVNNNLVATFHYSAYNGFPFVVWFYEYYYQTCPRPPHPPSPHRSFYCLFIAPIYSLTLLDKGFYHWMLSLPR